MFVFITVSIGSQWYIDENQSICRFYSSSLFSQFSIYTIKCNDDKWWPIYININKITKNRKIFTHTRIRTKNIAMWHRLRYSHKMYRKLLFVFNYRKKKRIGFPSLTDTPGVVAHFNSFVFFLFLSLSLCLPFVLMLRYKYCHYNASGNNDQSRICNWNKMDHIYPYTE